MDAHSRALPNGRDYYPQGAEAGRAAQQEWNGRQARLKSVWDDLGELAEAIRDAM